MPLTIIIQTYEGMSDAGKVYRSVDSGLNWDTVLTHPDGAGEGFYFRAIDTDNAGVWCIAGEYSIFRSTDYGQNWTEVFRVTDDLSDIRALKRSPSGVWCACGADGCIYRSTNNGLTWALQYTTDVMAMLPVIATDEAGTWMALDESVTYRRAYVSADDGATWNWVGTLDTNRACTCLETDGAGTWLVGTNLFGSNNGTIERSTNNGATWSTIYTFTGVSSSSRVEQISTDRDGVWCCTFLANPFIIARSTNDGSSWTTVYSNASAEPYGPWNVVTDRLGNWLATSGWAYPPPNLKLYTSADDGLTWDVGNDLPVTAYMELRGVAFYSGLCPAPEIYRIGVSFE